MSIARGKRSVMWAVAIAAAVVSTQALGAFSASATEGGYDWTKYEHDLASSGTTNDPGITAANAATLSERPGWPIRSTSGALISTQPLQANGLVYWGSWDGVEHATPLDGGSGGWSQALGTLTYPTGSQCAQSGVHGLGDSGQLYDDIVINGTMYASVLFIGGGGNDSVGGGEAKVYAIDALTGTILWSTEVGPAPDHYLWSSPVVYTPPSQNSPSVYEGVADVGEPCPVIRGEIDKLDATTGQIQATLELVPASCIGASVWGSLTVDSSLTGGANVIYAATGNGFSCSPKEAFADFDPRDRPRHARHRGQLETAEE